MFGKSSSRSASFVAKLRKISEKLKSGKAEIADAAIVGADRGLRDFGKFVNVLQAYVDVYKTVHTAFSAVTRNPVLRDMSRTFLGNVAQDVGSRANELANIVEAASKQPEVVVAVSNVRASAEAFNEATEIAAGEARRMKIVKH